MCGSNSVARIQFGLPAFTDELENQLKAGEVSLGGCLVWSEMPKFACNACQHKWRGERSVESDHT
jgi:hypothetical protein